MPLGSYLKTFQESHGQAKTLEFLSQGLKEGKITRRQLSLRDLAESLLGPAWQTTLQKKKAGLREAAEAVDASGFAAITGQLLVQEIREKYDSPEFIGDELCSLSPITNGNLGPQREPWLSDVVDDNQQIQQGMPYPQTGFKQQYVDYPPPAKYGLICAVTMEMIFSDLTKQAMDSAGSVGERVRINKEERQLKVVLGLVNNHSWNGTSYNTYQATSPWINTISGKTINDWTDLNDLEQLFVNLLDPVTGKPIRIKPSAALVQPYRWYNWKRINMATSTRTGAYGTTGTNPHTDAGSPLDVEYPVLKSAYAYQALLASGLTATQAKEYVVLGDFKKAFVYREVYPLMTVEAPPQNPMEFNQDIALAVKAGEYGVMCVRDPRFVVLSYAT